MQLFTVYTPHCTLCNNASEGALGVTFYDDTYGYLLPCGHAAYFTVGSATWELHGPSEAHQVFNAMRGEVCACEWFHRELSVFRNLDIQVGFTGKELYIGYSGGY